MKEREIITGVLRALGRRLWINRVIRDATFGLCIILFCLLCFQLVQPALAASVPFAASALYLALAVAFAAVTVEIARHCARRVSTRQAAAQADSRANLNDELTSAHWFLNQGEISATAQLHVRRAADTAARLDLASIAPRGSHANVLVVALLGLLLAALISVTPYLSHFRDFNQANAATGPGGASDPRALANDAPAATGIESLDLALRTLSQGEASGQEVARALADARDAIDRANMEAAAARDGLTKLAGALADNPRFEAVAQAVRQERIGDAVTLLRLQQAESAPAAAPENAADNLAGQSDAPQGQIDEALESAARDLAGMSTQINQEAIDRVIAALEQADERLEEQGQANSVKRNLEKNLGATAQRSQLTPSQFDSRSNAPNPMPSPDTGNSSMRGGTLFRQAAVARDEGESASEGSQAGEASGDAAALPLEGVATARLDAQLKLERMAQDSGAEGETGEDDSRNWFYSPTRAQQSSLPNESVRFHADHVRESAAVHDRVTVRQRNSVKNYFLNLHESEKK